MVPVDVVDAGFGFGHVAALVVVVDPAAKPAIDPERVAAILGLTEAESRIAIALSEGNTMRAIAAASHRAESTVRELVKRVHLKLGVSRRAELVRIVLALAGSDEGCHDRGHRSMKLLHAATGRREAAPRP